MVHVKAPREIFSDIKRTSDSVHLVMYSMIAFVSIATLRFEHRGGGGNIQGVPGGMCQTSGECSLC